MVGLCINSQTITPSVINSGGITSTLTINGKEVTYTDNIGEAVINTGTNSSHVLTQGFLQPEMKSVKGVSVAPLVTDVSCDDKQDGKIFMEVTNIPKNSIYVIRFTWLPAGVCPNTACQTIENLSAGTFTVRTAWSYTPQVGNPVSDSIEHIVEVKDVNGICEVKVYTGITLNGSNPKFTIDNIELYPKAKVTIFNRWGRKLFSEQEYNNIDKYWPARGEQVMPGTYFYVIELDGKMNRGWLEVFEQ